MFRVPMFRGILTRGLYVLVHCDAHSATANGQTSDDEKAAGVHRYTGTLRANSAAACVRALAHGDEMAATWARAAVPFIMAGSSHRAQDTPASFCVKLEHCTTCVS